MSSMNKYIFTSESVARGHPDKVCDQISDLIVDEYLKLDPYAKTAIECMVCPDNIFICGEFRSNSEISKDQLEYLVRHKVKEIGYNKPGFNWETVKITMNLNSQSPDIAIGVDSNETGKEEGAGDQGIIFGYACTETKNYMPAPIYYSHKILRVIEEAIQQGKIQDLGPDAKSQVSLVYENGMPVRAESIVVSIQHHEKYSSEDVRRIITPYVEGALPEGWMCKKENFYVNPTGRFVIGGPVGDSGLTGRKIIVDTYGGASPHGGGAFSGKDPSKVDRSAAYMARYVAKNIVASGIASKGTLQISYAIGVSKPLSIYINTHRTAKIDESEIIKFLETKVDFTPKGIRTILQLNKPIYSPTVVYGHFGREPEDNGAFSWEVLSLKNRINEYFS